MLTSRPTTSGSWASTATRRPVSVFFLFSSRSTAHPRVPLFFLQTETQRALAESSPSTIWGHSAVHWVLESSEIRLAESSRSPSLASSLFWEPLFKVKPSQTHLDLRSLTVRFPLFSLGQEHYLDDVC